MAKLNCWEFKKCGRHDRGLKNAERSICPAAKASQINGVHNGIFGGRCCYVVAGTFCDGKIQGTYAEKSLSCMLCDFYKLLQAEEGKKLVPVNTLQSLLAKK